MARRKFPKFQRGVMKSKLEVNTWDHLVKKHGRKARFEYETVKLGYTLTKNYIPDFVCYLPNGRIIFIEAKGYLRPEDRTKMIAVKKENPHLDIRFVFGRNNKLNKNSKTTYGAWADAHGFKWTVGTVPKEWFQ
jgi:hypothetical protein